MPDSDTKAVLRNIGANVKRLRIKRNWTQAELAEKIECEPSYEQKVEYATAQPSIALLVRIARVFEVPIGMLFRSAKTPAAKRGRPPNRKARLG